MAETAYPDIQDLIDGFNKLGDNPELEEVIALFNNIKIQLNIEAPNFKGTITGDLGQAVSDMQTNLQRVWAYGFSGSQNLVGNSAIKENIVLSLNVEKGSTDLSELMPHILEGALKIPGIRNMKPTQWFCLFLIAVLSFSCYQYMDLHYQNEQNQKIIEQNQELINRFSEGITEAQNHDLEILRLALNKEQENKAIVARNVPQATAVQFGAHHLSQQDLDNLRKPSTRERAKIIPIEGTFVIYQVCNLGNQNLRIHVRDLQNGSEFPVSAEQDLFSDPETYDKIWNYAKNKTPTKLQITESRKSSGSMYRLEAIDLE